MPTNLHVESIVLSVYHDRRSSTTGVSCCGLCHCQLLKTILERPTVLSMKIRMTLLLPMSTADCERRFSALQRIKTDLRNRLSNKVLHYLLSISIEGPPPADFPYNEACDIWAGWRNRRIQV